MRFLGVIFDLDGVLVHTDEFHYLAWKELADKLGIYFDRKINERLKGVSRLDSLEIILEKSDKQYSSLEKEDFAEQKNKVYRSYLAKMTSKDVSADVRSTLVKLKKAGVKLAVGSSSKNAKMILNRTELMDYFDAIADGEQITRSKPDPEVFLKAAEMISLETKNCLVVEDALPGIDAAKNGGFFAAGICGAADYIKTDYPIKEISDILNIVQV